MALWAEKFSWFCQNCILLFRGTFEQKNSRLLVLAWFFEHRLPKLYSTCQEALFAEFFSQNHINWHCERKNSAGFVRTALYFSGELLSKTILEVVVLVFFLVLARFFKHGLPKLYSTCPEALFAEFFSQNHIKCHYEPKNSAGFVKTAFYFSGELLSKTILEVVVLVFFLVLARFFKHGWPKLYSTSPEALFAEFFFTETYYLTLWAKKISFFPQNSILFFRGTVEQNNSRSRRFGVFSSHCQILQAWVVKTVFYVSRGTFCGFFFHRILLIGTVSGKIQLVLSELHSTFPGNFWPKQFSFTSPCQILQALVAKTVFYVSRGTFCGTFFTESY